MNRSLPSVGLYCYASKWNLFPFLHFVVSILKCDMDVRYMFQHQIVQLVSLRPTGHKVTSFLHFLMTDIGLNETFIHKIQAHKIDFFTTLSNFCTLPQWSTIFPFKSSCWCRVHPDLVVFSSQYLSILRPKLTFIHEQMSDFPKILTIKTSRSCF